MQNTTAMLSLDALSQILIPSRLYHPLECFLMHLFHFNNFFETGIKEIKIRTNAVVDVITKDLMTFGTLLGEIKKRSYVFNFD